MFERERERERCTCNLFQLFREDSKLLFIVKRPFAVFIGNKSNYTAAGPCDTAEVTGRWKSQKCSEITADHLGGRNQSET